MEDKTLRISASTHAKLKRYCGAVGIGISEFVEQRLLGALDSPGVDSLIDSIEAQKSRALERVSGREAAA